MRLNLIFACARKGVIGLNNTLPWHLPEDLAHFKKTTLGQPVIMGRKTWESLPPKFRPLPGRTNIVVTRQTDWQAPGAHVAHSMAQALAVCSTEAEVWVIGGAEVYAQALPLAQRAVITEIDADFEGDETFTQPDQNNTLSAIYAALNTITPTAVIIGLCSIVLLTVWEKPWIKKNKLLQFVPGPLVVVLLAVMINEIVSVKTGLGRLETKHLVSLPVAASASEFISFSTIILQHLGSGSRPTPTARACSSF